MKPGDIVWLYYKYGPIEAKVCPKPKDEDDDPTTVLVYVWGSPKEASLEHVFLTKEDAERAYQVDLVLHQ